MDEAIHDMEISIRNLQIALELGHEEAAKRISRELEYDLEWLIQKHKEEKQLTRV